MKGYRTIALSIATILLGLVGRHVAPDLINAYLDVIFAVIGLGFLSLRLITNTPFGAKIATDLGVSPQTIQELISRLDPDLPDTLNSAATDLNNAVGTLMGHLPVQQAAIDTLAAAAQTIANPAVIVAPARIGDPAIDTAQTAPLSATTTVNPVGPAPAPVVAPVQ